jgi:hypothetical protein
MTIRVRIIDEIIPPIMGAAMRCMTSEPVPVLHKMGMSPAMMATMVIIFGRTRSTAAARLAGRAADLGKDDAIALSFGGIARGAAAAFDKLLAREPEKGNFITDLRTRIKAEQHVA